VIGGFFLPQKKYWKRHAGKGKVVHPRNETGRERERALVLYRRLSSPVAVGKKKKMTLADPPSLLNFNGLETIG
jgi:hypothetical protein